MSERLAEIAITRQLRDKIKETKKEKSYSVFLSELIEKKGFAEATNPKTARLRTKRSNDA